MPWSTPVTGHREVIDADLRGYYDSIPHAELLKSVARRVSDGRMLRLIKIWLQAPVEEIDRRGRCRRTTRAKDTGRGCPQGAPLSPLLSNLYMRRVVLGWKVNYFCLGPVSKAYRAVDRHACRRLRRWLCKKHKVRGQGISRYPDKYLHQELHLVKLGVQTRSFPWAKA